MPTFKDIRAKNAQFAATARENAGKPRIRTKDADVTEESSESSQKQRRGRAIVKPPKKTKTSAALTNNFALALICFVVIGGVFFELMRLFL